MNHWNSGNLLTVFRIWWKSIIVEYLEMIEILFLVRVPGVGGVEFFNFLIYS